MGITSDDAYCPYDFDTDPPGADFEQALRDCAAAGDPKIAQQLAVEFIARTLGLDDPSSIPAVIEHARSFWPGLRVPLQQLLSYSCGEGSAPADTVQ